MFQKHGHIPPRLDWIIGRNADVQITGRRRSGYGQWPGCEKIQNVVQLRSELSKFTLFLVLLVPTHHGLAAA